MSSNNINFNHDQNSNLLYYPQAESEYTSLQNFCIYFKIYFYVLLFLGTISYMFVLYLTIYVTPKEAHMLKYHLLNCNTWNYLLVLIFVLWQPIPLFPFIGGFSNGVFKYLGNEGCLLAINLFSIIIVGLIIGIVACQMNKVVVFQPPGVVTDFLSQPKNMAMSFLVLWGVSSTIMVVTMRMACTVETDFGKMINRMKDQEYASFLRVVLEKEMSVTTFSINSNGWAYAYALWKIILILSATSVLVFLNYRLKKAVCLTKGIVTEKTFRLQLQLSRSLTFCGIVFILNIILPIAISLLCVFEVVKNQYVGIVAFCIIPTYPLVFYALVAFMIKPYRQYVFRMVKTNILRDNSVHSSDDVSPNRNAGSADGVTPATGTAKGERTESAKDTTTNTINHAEVKIERT